MDPSLLIGAGSLLAGLLIGTALSRRAKPPAVPTATVHVPIAPSADLETLKRDVRDLSTIINTVEHPVWKRDGAQRIVYCNVAFSEIAEEISDDAAHVEELELFQGHRAIAKKALDSGEPQQVRRHIIVHGKRLLFDIHEVPFSSEGITVGYALNVSELEVAQEEIQRHISALRDLLESSTAAMAIYGKDGRLKYYNFAFTSLWKLDEHWLSAEPAYGEILEALREKRKLPEHANFLAFKQAQLKLFTTLIEPDESFYYLPDGKILRAIAIPHALGGILFVYEDVTDRVALERSYNTLIAVQRETLDHLHEGVAVFNEDGRLRLCNPMFHKLWQLSEEFTSAEPHVRDWLDKSQSLFISDNWPEFSAQLVSRFQQRQYMAMRFDLADGSVIDCACVPLPDGATLITFIDVTDSTLLERSLRERNEALEAADRVKTEFLANMSYELRSPLTSISGFAEMLSKSYIGPLNATQAEYVNHIFESSQHLSQLISAIIDLATIEAGYMQLNMAEFDLPTAIEQVCSLSGQGLQSQGLSLRYHVNAGVSTLHGDEMRVKQIVLNLVTTLAKYAKSGSELTVSVSADTIATHIAVQGTMRSGAQNLSHWFDGSSAGYNASELGLTIVRRFVGLHGGVLSGQVHDDSVIALTATFPRQMNESVLRAAG